MEYHKRLKRSLKLIIISGCMFASTIISPNAAAYCCDEAFIELFPYLGVDLYYAHMRAKASYRSLFPSNYLSGSLYAGVKFHPNLGFELGYDWSRKKSANWTLSRGLPVFGSVANRTFSGQTKIRRSGAHLDLVGFLPIWECLEFIAYFGAGWVQPKIETTMSIKPGAAEPNSSAIASLTGESRALLRLGVGVRYMLTDLLGIRGKLGYEATSMLRVKGNSYFQQLGYGTRPFSRTGSLSLGLFYKF